LGAVEEIRGLRKRCAVVANIGEVEIETGDADQKRDINDINIRSLIAVIRQCALTNFRGILT
jgi:hypothetical protein